MLNCVQYLNIFGEAALTVKLSKNVIEKLTEYKEILEQTILSIEFYRMCVDFVDHYTPYSHCQKLNKQSLYQTPAKILNRE